MLGGALDPEFCVGVSKGCEVVGHHQQLTNCPWLDEIMSQTIQQVQPPHADKVVHEDEVLLWEYPKVLGVISVPSSSTSVHYFRVCRLD